MVKLALFKNTNTKKPQQFGKKHLRNEQELKFTFESLPLLNNLQPFMISLFCDLILLSSRFSIHIANYLLWLLTFYYSLFPRLFIFFLLSESFVSSLVIQFFGITPFFTPYKKCLPILVYFCIWLKCRFLIHDLA